MPLAIKDEGIVDLAHRLAALTGEPVSKAVRIAVEERLEREKARRSGAPLRERLQAIAHHCASLPAISDRTDDEILGYDERGLLGRR